MSVHELQSEDNRSKTGEEWSLEKRNAIATSWVLIH